VIIWLNGPFGGGKTTTAHAICDRDESIVLFDAEEVGFMLRHALNGKRPVTDFQDWPAWRSLVVATAMELATYLQCDLVIPQSVFTRTYWQELATGFASAGMRMRAFTLNVHPGEIQQRIVTDDNESGAVTWRLAKAMDYQNALPWLAAETTMIETLNRTPDNIASFILEDVARPNHYQS
jgi:hypothetical protein